MTGGEALTPAQHLAHVIAETGPVPISTLMEIALAHPAGYYTAHPGIGEDGDFITAPEISQVFGELIGVWVLQSWIDIGAPERWQLIELGPGRGTLMSDLLRVLKLRQRALDGLEVHLVETSPRLRDIQRTALSKTGLAPRWVTRLDEVNHAPFILVANEFFDALPIRQFVRARGAWCERRVALAPNSSAESLSFAFVAQPTLVDVEAQIALAHGALEGEIIEYSEPVISISSQIGARLGQQRGRALLIDYGYDGERHGDTLQAIRAHKKVPVLEDVGLADVTAHVDFAALKTAALESGAETFGAISQASFLQRMGIAERYDALLRKAGEPERARMSRQLRRLTDQIEMGELFRAVSLASPGLPVPPGF